MAFILQSHTPESYRCAEQGEEFTESEMPLLVNDRSLLSAVVNALSFLLTKFSVEGRLRIAATHTSVDKFHEDIPQNRLLTAPINCHTLALSTELLMH